MNSSNANLLADNQNLSQQQYSSNASNCMREPSSTGWPHKQLIEQKPNTTLDRAAPPWMALLGNSTSGRNTLMLSYLCPFIQLFPSCPCSEPRGSGHKPHRIYLCPQIQAPEHPTCISHPVGVCPTRARSASSPTVGSFHSITVLTAPKPPTSPLLRRQIFFFLHISQNSTDGQNLPRLFLPLGHKSHMGTALQRSNPSQHGEHPPKPWAWKSAFQFICCFPDEEQEWPEKTHICTSDLQVINAPRATTAPLSSSPPTHSTDFCFEKRCGKKQARQRRRSAKQQ